LLRLLSRGTEIVVAQFPDSPSTGSNYVVGGRIGDHFRYADISVLILRLNERIGDLAPTEGAT